MFTFTARRSYLPLLRCWLPRHGPDARPSAGDPAIDDLQEASFPGQNAVEVYGTSLLMLGFTLTWCSDLVGSWWVGVPTSLLFIHLSGLLSAVIGHHLHRRYVPPHTKMQASVWPQRVWWTLAGLMAWVAVLVPFPHTRGLAWVLLLLLLANFLAWTAERGWLGLGIVGSVHLIALGGLPLFGGWIALGLLLPCHAAMLYGSLTPHATLFGPRLRKVPLPEGSIWLTIDDGPAEDTSDFLHWLDHYEAKATFFVVGQRAAAAPERLSWMVERGHELANHSFSHPEKWFWCLPWRALRREVEESQNLLERLSGKRPRLFRSPVGFANPLLQPQLDAAGLIQVGWTARGLDGVDDDVDRVLQRLTDQIQPGAIVLLHQGRKSSVAILKGLLEWLETEGIRCELPNLFENEADRLS